MDKETQLNPFEAALASFILSQQQSDPLFSEAFSASLLKGKSHQGCARYIISEVRKLDRAGFADEEIFSLAIHYWTEDSVSADCDCPSCSVTVNSPSEEKRFTVPSHSTLPPATDGTPLPPPPSPKTGDQLSLFDPSDF